jgi:hypothetical protein
MYTAGLHASRRATEKNKPQNSRERQPSSNSNAEIASIHILPSICTIVNLNIEIMHIYPKQGVRSFGFEKNGLITHIRDMYYTYHTEQVENAIEDINRELLSK